MNDREVKRYEATDYDQVIEFIERVSNVQTINQEIIEQSILVKQAHRIDAMVSFEIFNQIGMLRYFIYDQSVVPELLVNMFFELYKCAKEKQVNQLVAIAPNIYAQQLFELLGFKEIKKKGHLMLPDLLKSDDIQLMGIRFN